MFHVRVIFSFRVHNNNDTINLRHTVDGNSAFCFRKNTIIVYATRSAEPASISRRHTYVYVHIPVSSCARCSPWPFSNHNPSVKRVLLVQIFGFDFLGHSPIAFFTRPARNLSSEIDKKKLKTRFLRALYAIIYYVRREKKFDLHTLNKLCLRFFFRLKLYCFSDRFNA